MRNGQRQVRLLAAPTGGGPIWEPHSQPFGGKTCILRTGVLSLKPWRVAQVISLPLFFGAIYRFLLFIFYQPCWMCFSARGRVFTGVSTPQGPFFASVSLDENAWAAGVSYKAMPLAWWWSVEEFHERDVGNPNINPATLRTRQIAPLGLALNPLFGDLPEYY